MGSNLRTSKTTVRKWDSAAISLCLDQMTGKGSLPAPLMAPIYDEERGALQAAVHAAPEEDVKGTVSMGATKRINESVAKLRDKFIKNTSRFDGGYDDALQYPATVAYLSRMLNDPGMRRFLQEFKNNEERTVGDLIAFMDSYNLRFVPATTERQLEIYARRVPILTAVRDSVKTAQDLPPPPDRTGEGLKAAAREAFKPMNWENLETHARDQ
jgi:hypothetical protein